MFRRCAERSSLSFAAWWPALAAACLLSACGSSPSKDSQDEPVASAQGERKVEQKSRKRGEPDVESQEAAPVGPPPIPPEATQQFERALTLLSAGDFAQAAADLQRLADAYPDYAGPLVNLGIVHQKTGNLAEAEKVLKAATQRGEPNAAAFNQLGIVYRKLGRFKEADQAYTQALSIDPNYALAHLNLGVLCDMYLGDAQRALTAYEAYLQRAPNPDARVAGWVKELRNRLGIAEPRPPAPSATSEQSAPAHPTPAQPIPAESAPEPAAQTAAPASTPSEVP